ncbi:hypothetical protein TNCV_4125261 [Trichonephila clavipes]|nr:hypothetical protein TNCV_4125261 [Trichonephila clavipes]
MADANTFFAKKNRISKRDQFPKRLAISIVLNRLGNFTTYPQTSCMTNVRIPLGCPGLKCPKVMAYGYVTTHQNVIKSSGVGKLSEIFRILSDRLHVRALFGNHRQTFYTDFISTDVDAPVKMQCVLWLQNLNQSHVYSDAFEQDGMKVITQLPNRLIRTPTK